MDGFQFDALSRRLGATRSRRGALKTLAAVVVAGLVGAREASAQTFTGPYQPCSSDSQCCSGSLCEWGMCMPGCRIDGQFTHPGASPAGNTCHVCNPAVSTTTASPANEGMSCWSGNPLAGATFCQNGACAPRGATSCPPLTACHLEGTVDPNTGQCVYPPAPEGTPCGIGEMCHGGFYQPADACDGNGFCIGGGSKTVNCAPYRCDGTACATSCASDTDCTSGAACCEGQCAYLNTVEDCGACGITCDAVDACTPGYCDNGVCNQESACPPGSGCCNGQCVSLNSVTNCGNCGTVCEAVDACTPGWCDNGTCNQTSACAPVDACTPASCDNGICTQTSACPPTSGCFDGNCFLIYPHCPGNIGVAANSGGYNVCIAGENTGATCDTSSECGTNEVCILRLIGEGGGYQGYCTPGYPM